MDAQLLGRWIASDTIVPEPGNPQALNRYAYGLNNPLKYTDPTGHSACMPLAPVGPAFAVCQLGERILQYGPQIINLIQQLTISAPQAPALVDQFAQATQASGNGSASSNAGNTADPGGLDPNNWDPNRWGTNYRANYEQYYGVERDSAYQVHHVLPQRFQDILSKASQGRINVDDPRWLREVLKNDSPTGTAVHQRLYTDVWQNWAQQLGRDPTAQEIIQFARQLEAQYATEGTLFYREGAHLAGRIDWNTLLQLLQGG